MTTQEYFQNELRLIEKEIGWVLQHLANIGAKGLPTRINLQGEEEPEDIPDPSQRTIFDEINNHTPAQYEYIQDGVTPDPNTDGNESNAEPTNDNQRQ